VDRRTPAARTEIPKLHFGMIRRRLFAGERAG
jgi:hypothetical protein